MTDSNIKSITDETYEEEVLQSEIPVLVLFYADWCSPCKMTRPVLENLAEEYTDIKFVKINIDEEGSSVRDNGIRGIPTLILYVNGKPVGSKVGMCGKSQYVAFLHNYKEEL